jgi:hypothetical protein
MPHGPGPWLSAMAEKWHRPYAKALMENDPEKRRAWIAEAEKSILARYLELQSTPGLEIQFCDLQRATEELKRLKLVTPKAQRSLNWLAFLRTDGADTSAD